MSLQGLLRWAKPSKRPTVAVLEATEPGRGGTAGRPQGAADGALRVRLVLVRCARTTGRPQRATGRDSESTGGENGVLMVEEVSVWPRHREGRRRESRSSQPFGSAPCRLQNTVSGTGAAIFSSQPFVSSHTLIEMVPRGATLVRSRQRHLAETEAAVSDNAACRC
ncbi:hypothetical protein AAFF_G00391380 [Aldrovandia affinis]|uniref:Uncharacterized protein n=1 Tax=Aldrovandia affinis TaxID=143900 RepID=A0AAD7WLT9_9TELE|nr:hypothetical protein AAFF_G00391380 [Aldrovandia affinis]